MKNGRKFSSNYHQISTLSISLIWIHSSLLFKLNFRHYKFPKNNAKPCQTLASQIVMET